MDALREVTPFFVGMLAPPLVILTLTTRARRSGALTTVASFVVALVLGVCTSAIAGELTLGLPDGLIAVLIDTSLAYTGSQAAYRLAWKPAIEARRRGRAMHQGQVQVKAKENASQ